MRYNVGDLVRVVNVAEYTGFDEPHKVTHVYEFDSTLRYDYIVAPVAYPRYELPVTNTELEYWDLIEELGN